MAKITVPCDVCIKRFYRAYVEVDENATADEVKAALIEDLLDGGNIDEKLSPDIDLEPSEHEEQDICWINPDFDGSWYSD